MSRNRNESRKTAFSTRLSLLGVFALSVGFVFASRLSYADVEVEKNPEAVGTSIPGNIDFDARVGVAGVYKNGFQTQVVLSWNSDSDVVGVE